MKVSKLKSLLKNLPANGTVRFVMNSGCCGDVEVLDLIDTDVLEQTSATHGDVLELRFSAVPGYNNCNKVKQIKQLSRE